MTEHTVAQEIDIDAPVDVVWRTLTDPEQVQLWFADEVDVAPTPGADGTLVFGDTASPESHTSYVRVVAVEPERTFSYRWNHDQGTEPADGNSVLVEFTLTSTGSGTRLRVVETGVDAMSWTEDEKETYVRDHAEGWQLHFGRLAAVVSKADSSA